MRFIVSTFLALILVGCATVDFQPYEGRNNLYEGEGGTKVAVDGVEFWANGTPPRKYSIIGMVVSEVGSGIGDEAIIRSAVASEVKAKGGDAAIQVNNNSSFAGVIRTAPNMYMATGVRRMQFAVIKYVQ
jgi:type V secretory pathway adhesin AidA